MRRQAPGHARWMFKVQAEGHAAVTTLFPGQKEWASKPFMNLASVCQLCTKGMWQWQCMMWPRAMRSPVCKQCEMLKLERKYNYFVESLFTVFTVGKEGWCTHSCWLKSSLGWLGLWKWLWHIKWSQCRSHTWMTCWLSRTRGTLRQIMLLVMIFPELKVAWVLLGSLLLPLVL